MDARTLDGLANPPDVFTDVSPVGSGALALADGAGPGAVMNLTDHDEMLLRCRTTECAVDSIHVTVIDGPCTGQLSDPFGGMAVVDEVHETESGRRVVLKMMNHRLLFHVGAKARLQREADLLMAGP